MRLTLLNVAWVRDIRVAYKILVGKPEGKRPPAGKPRRKWDYNIEMDHKEIGWEFVDWIHLAQERPHKLLLGTGTRT
jgi:hypothetical protein